MSYAYFSPELKETYKVCLLVPNIKKDEIKKAYLDSSSLVPDDLLVMDLHYRPDGKKPPMAEMRDYITQELAPTFEQMNVQYVLCTDGDYFKALTKAAKVEVHLGYVMTSTMGPWKVIYVPNFSQIFYDPEKTRAKIAMGMSALTDHMIGTYSDPGISIIKKAHYPKTDAEIKAMLQELLEDGRPLTADIEGFGLKHWECGIGTIAFAWNQGEGLAFPVDYKAIPGAAAAPYGTNKPDSYRRALLRSFFEECYLKGINIKWHNIAFDVYVLIYQLFMDHILDQEGLLHGLEIMLGNHDGWDCTKLITYLATNSCAGNKLGLKDQAQEFAGNYAVDEIKDITKIPLPKLLEYNLVDALSTWYVFDKNHPQMVKDDQLNIYNTLFKPSTVDIVQMQLTGMPVNMTHVLEVEIELETEQQRAINELRNTQVISHYEQILRGHHVRKRNEKLKKKQITLEDEETLAVRFNPNSNDQLQELLFEVLGLPIVGYTDNGNPSADGDSIKALLNHTKDPDILKFLTGLKDYKDVNKMLTDFIPSLKNAQLGNDGWHYLFGNFNLGGTKSGRLSSSGPNLQNLPASSRYSKLIKSCFQAPPGWLFCGLDFDSLEDRISALTSKDPNKLKVYMGHVVYEIDIDGIIHHIRDDDTIVYDGQSLTGEQFYELYGSDSSL